MIADLAIQLFNRLEAGMANHKPLALEAKAIYLERFAKLDYEAARLTVERFIDDERARFPNLGWFLSRYGLVRVELRAKKDRDPTHETILTFEQCVKRRQRCTELIDKKHGWDLISQARTDDPYWTKRLGACERELDELAPLQPSVEQFDAALRNYYACLDALGRWTKEFMYARPTPLTEERRSAMRQLVDDLAKRFGSGKALHDLA